MAELHGQHDNRDERNQQTRDWMGAASQTDFGETITEELSDYVPDMQVVTTTVDQIRISIQSGMKVRLGERHRPTLAAIIAALTLDERSQVTCDMENVMPDETEEQKEQRKTPVPSFIRGDIHRDIIRPKKPVILSVENGGLTKSK